MAKKPKKETGPHVLWSHKENGKTTVRRIQALEVQDHLGMVHIITPDDSSCVIRTSAKNRVSKL